MRHLVPLVLFALAGCGGVASCPPPKIVTVEKPVDDPACAREARDRLGTSPAYPDTADALKAAPDIFAAAQLLLAGRAIRSAREAALVAAIGACAK